jgi:hypothetical protein
MEPMNTSTVYNPIPRRRTPSAAFKESMMRAKELSAQEGWNEDTDHYNIERNSLRHIGWRTFLFGILMFVGGVIMTVLGACTYWGSTETTKHNGLDLFVVGLISEYPYVSYSCCQLNSVIELWLIMSSSLSTLCKLIAVSPAAHLISCS